MPSILLFLITRTVKADAAQWFTSNISNRVLSYRIPKTGPRILRYCSCNFEFLSIVSRKIVSKMIHAPQRLQTYQLINLTKPIQWSQETKIARNENSMKLIYAIQDITLYSICLEDAVMVITELSGCLIVTMIYVKCMSMVTLHV
jgi:hypothetical protein